MTKTVDFSLSGTLVVRKKKKSKIICFVTIGQGAFSVTARGEDMSYTLASGMQVHVKISYVDKNGNPAVVDGDVAWATSNTATLDVVVDPADSMLATVQAIGPTGQAQVTATADADLGDGVRELVTTMDVDVVAGEAVAGTIAPVGSAESIP